MGLTFTTAFVAGMVSFISPCVLPLAPGYVAMISGVTVDELQQRERGFQWIVLLNALLFVLGFSILFVALGVTAGAVGRFLSANREILNRIAGVVIIFFGTMLLGWIRIPAFGRAAILANKLKLHHFSLVHCFGNPLSRSLQTRVLPRCYPQTWR